MFRFLLVSLMLFATLALSANPYIVRTFPDENGRIIEEVVVPGIPEALRKPGPVATPSRSAVILTDVPKLNWCYGCSATSAAMIAGYYDRNGYPNMYAGPTNGGVFPGTNSSWGYEECPLSATHQGYDGLATQGHVNRFWVAMNNSGNDPYGTGDPTATYANCTTDYMGTNQDWWSNSDGSTRFYNYENGSPLYDYSGAETSSPRKRDGIHGFRLFMESRAYQVATNYNQYIYGYEGNTMGYSLAQFQQSIDNGIPVMIHIEGHTMVGVGYESTSNLIYIHDTWDHSVHSMTWGGSYSGMPHYAVSVIQLASAPAFGNITWNPGSFSSSLDINASTVKNLVIGNTGTGTLEYQCTVPTSSSTALSEGFNTGNIPSAWTQAQVSGNSLQWNCASGGHSGNPNTAYEGAYNALLYNSSYTSSVVKLISPALNLQAAGSASLQFWHAQAEWSGDQDELRVYYKTSAGGAWNLLETYLEDTPDWTQRSISLPNLSSTYYVAFEGTTNYGFGVCLDQITISSQTASNSWLSINGGTSASGSINAGAANQSLSIGFDATGLSAGSYSSTITIQSNSASNSELTLPVSLTVFAPLIAPEELSIQLLEASNSVRISWNAASGSPSGYKVYFCTDPGFNSGVTLIASTAANRLYYVHSGVGSRPKGFYRVVAIRN